MFFITTNNGKLIAADEKFLDKFGVKDIFEATALMQNDTIAINDDEQSISFDGENIGFSKTRISTFLGDVTLYNLNNKLAKEKKSVLDLGDNKSDELEKRDDDQDEILSFIEQHNTNINKSESIQTQEADGKNDEMTIAEDKQENLSIEEKEKDQKNDISDDDLIQILDEPKPSEDKEDNDKEKENDEKENGILDTLEDIVPLAGVAGAAAAASTAISKDESISLEEEKSDDQEPNREDNELFQIQNEPTSTPQNDTISLEDSRDDLIDFTDNTPKTYESQETKTSDATLVADDAESISMQTEAEKSKKSQEKYIINLALKANQIGVSEDEYRSFLDAFKEESVALENNLRSADIKENKEAINSLKEAASLLMLPDITDRLDQFLNVTSSEKNELIDDFYSFIDSIELVSDKEKTKEEINLNSDLSDLKEKDEENTINETDLEAFDLDKTEPLQFDFSINVAAEELSLPPSLVGEFVLDFIDQAKENLPTLKEAYKNNNIDQIEKTAHLLKGASSNLRINPIADTLFELQTNTEIKKVPEIVSKFLSQLKALSNHMAQQNI